ncbi:MAG: aminotransferase class I/II-fold pyridoxal phosphate-dependent enzyme [Acutalibacteraceae bacterium]
MTKQELDDIYKKLNEEYELFLHKNLNLNMARGKPGSEQLDLSMKMLDALNSSSNFNSAGGADCRNYGINDGLPEMKAFISEVTGISPKNFIVGGNSSLSMMYDAISHFFTHGSDGELPWGKQKKTKFLCPSPGYDRHFAICEYFGIEMIIVPMTDSGPDMDVVEKYVSSDDSIKGIWCVPKYSNPQGITYSDETVKRFAKLKPAAKDFKIFWDNAYFVHDLSENPTPLLNIMDECIKNGTEKLPLIFFSTSKITFPGAGIAFMACMGENLVAFKKMYSIKTVGFDKLNQLRHLRFLKNKESLLIHMKNHRNILAPKFDLVIEFLNKEFLNNPIISWKRPNGGYFVSVDTYPGCADRVVELCKNCGVILTSAGATFPYGKDPRNSNIRLAPTFPGLNELKIAMEVFCLSVKIAFIESCLK